MQSKSQLLLNPRQAGKIFDKRLYYGYTMIMKTAISIPDKLFETADKTAKKLKISRSELYQIAIKKFVEEFNEDVLIKSLNETYETEDSKLDKSIEKLQMNTIQTGTLDDSW